FLSEITSTVCPASFAPRAKCSTNWAVFPLGLPPPWIMRMFFVRNLVSALDTASNLFVLHIVVPAPALCQLPVGIRLIVVPQLLDAVEADGLLEAPECTPAPDRCAEFVFHPSRREVVHKGVHDAVFVDIIFCRKMQEPLRFVLNQSGKRLVGLTSDP